MQTQVITKLPQPDHPLGPWLQRVKESGQASRRIRLSRFPFHVGRADTADLTIDSDRVSREHAAILCVKGQFSVQDFGSTNGTFVNGRQITEVALNDGDMIVIADIEFTFFSGAPSRACNSATQIIDAAESPNGASANFEPAEPDYLDVLRGVRRLRESLMHRGVSIRFLPVVRFEDDKIFAYEALGCGSPLNPSSESYPVASVECRLNRRIHELQRLIAAEQAAALDPQAWLMVNVETNDVGAEELADSLVRLRRLLQQRHLVVQLHDSAVSDTPLLRDFRDRLQREQIGLAFDGFASSASQIRQQRDIAPELFKLAAPLIRKVHEDDQRRRQVKQIVDAAGEIGSQVVATGVQSSEEADVCRELGCQYAQGTFFMN